MRPLRLRARWVLPVVAEPIAHGAVLAVDGRIVVAGPDAAVPHPDDADARDLGNAILMPGLVNTHTHLELTALRGLAPARPFRDWIVTVRRLKDALTPDDFRASARCGALDNLAAGITTVGDTGSSGAPGAAMADLGLRGVAFQEVFGPDPARCAAALSELTAAFDALERGTAHAAPRVVPGVSPHAPYTVSAELLRAVVVFARARSAPVAMHLAESREETALVRDGDGPFAEALRCRGIRVTGAGCSPVAWVARGGLLELAPLLIHCVQADAGDIAAIARARATVAHCPWSNQELGHGAMDLTGLRAAGVGVGLGTDSVATGAPLDLFREGRLAAARAGLAPRDVVRFLTRDGARALGLADVGELRPGAWADLLAVAPREAADPETGLVRYATPADVRATWVAGALRYDGGQWPGVDAATEYAALDRAGAAARAALSSLL